MVSSGIYLHQRYTNKMLCILAFTHSLSIIRGIEADPDIYC